MYNYIKLIAKDINKINGLVKRTNVITIPQANLLTRKESNYKKGNIRGELLLILKKRKLKQLEQSSVINYSSNNSTKNSSKCNKGSKGGIL